MTCSDLLQEEFRLPLRWIGLLYGRTAIDLCASTGTHDGATVVKQILAGARAVQVTSALYLHGPAIIGRMLEEVTEWMDEHGIDGIESFRGKLSRFHTERPELFERAQYVKAFVGTE